MASRKLRFIVTWSLVGSIGAGVCYLAASSRDRGQVRAVRLICAQRLKAMRLAMDTYRSWEGRYPPSKGGEYAAFEAIFPTLGTPVSFVCPASDSRKPDVMDGAVSLTPATCSYIYLPALLGVELGEDAPPGDVIMMCDREPYHDGGRNVLFGDGIGGLKCLLEGDFQRALQASRRWYWSKGCRDNLVQIIKALRQYAAQHDGCLPVSNDEDGSALAQVLELLPSRAALTCPLSRQDTQPLKNNADKTFTENDCDYEYVPTSVDTPLAIERLPGNLILAHDKTAIHDGGRHVLFVDGHVELVGENEFQEMLERSRAQYTEWAEENKGAD